MNGMLIICCVLSALLGLCILARRASADVFASNTGYYLAGDGSWAGQMAAASADKDGNTGLVPVPLVGQQNAYLRGDGKWIQANNGPTAAQYYMTTQPDNKGPYGANSVFPFSTTPMIDTGGGAITQISPTQFRLAAGYAFKLSASLNYSTSTVETIFQWYDVTTEIRPIGVSGDVSVASNLNAVAFAYVVAEATPILVQLHINVGAETKIAGGTYANNYGRAPWALIEVVSNNNTITAFKGATSTKDGAMGFLPPPPAGTQNSFLRGDGNWVQPTAAQYLHRINTLASVVPINTSIPFDTLVSTAPGTTAITYNSSTFEFTLLAGYGYKLTAGEFSQSTTIYQWYNITTPGYIGVGGDTTASGWANIVAIAYITPTITTLVSVRSVNGTSSLGYFGANGGTLGSWATIEVISNNNTITQFAGATSTAAGGIGYIPPPLAGQQNHVLTGSGNWRPACPAFATYISYAAADSTLRFTGTNTNTIVARGINIDASGTKIIPTVPGYYECRASWNSGGNPADSNINISFNGGGLTTYGTSQVGKYQSGVVESIILFNGTTDYIQITNRDWNFGQAQVNIKWFSS